MEPPFNLFSHTFGAYIPSSSLPLKIQSTFKTYTHLPYQPHTAANSSQTLTLLLSSAAPLTRVAYDIIAVLYLWSRNLSTSKVCPLTIPLLTQSPITYSCLRNPGSCQIHIKPRASQAPALKIN